MLRLEIWAAHGCPSNVLAIYLHGMRALSILLLTLVSGTSSAQNWCAPGATWTYEAGMFLAGFIRMSYTHDTLIDGFNAQVIDQYRAVQYPQPPPDPIFGGPPVITYTPVAVITRTENDVVLIRGGSTWDTLYWFGAAPGDRWSQAHVEDTSCAPFVVVDTGTTLFDGIPLRWIGIEDWYRVYERIGSTWDMFMYCPNWIIDGPLGMRCYRDDAIDVGFTQTPCEALVGVEENFTDDRMLPFPNPGSEHFALTLGPGTHSIALYDATGRVVHEERTPGARLLIGTSALPAGPYRIVVRSDGEAIRSAMWLKQP